jgi:uncharacterized surface protein with fasciclin (FAS1) repeats
MRSILATATLLVATIHAQDLQTVLDDHNSLSILASLLGNNTELFEELSSAQGITILAPSNDAWSELAELTDSIVLDPSDQDGVLTALLQYHVLSGRYTSSNITSGPSPFIHTLLEDRTYVNITGGQVVHATSVNDTVTFYSGYNLPSRVTEADIAFDGGYIHIIDAPLTVPANITTTALYSNLTSLIGATEFAAFPWDDWANATFFAPTNEAFARIGSAFADLSQDGLHTILMYHVINDTTPVYTSRIDHAEWISTTGTNVTWTYPIEEGETIYVNEAAILVPDVIVAGGVMHILDKYILPILLLHPDDKESS